MNLQAIKSTAGLLLSRFAANWQKFLLIHIAINMIVFIVMAPLASSMLHFAVSLSGNAALSDQDIAFFFLSPAGFLSLLVIGSVFSIIVFLEYAALLVAARCAEEGQPATISMVIWILARHSVSLFRLALLILLRVLLNLLPFLILASVVYLLLLSEYDINYYLSGKPPEWRLSVMLGMLLAAAAGLNLVRLFVSWLLALPLLLFNGIRPYAALKQSHLRVVGHRLNISVWLLGWLLSVVLVAVASSAFVTFLGRLIIPLVAESINALILALGVVSLVGFLMSFAITFVAYSFLSLFILMWHGKLFDDLESKSTPRLRSEIQGKAGKQLKSNRHLVAWSLLVGVIISLLVANFQLARLSIEDHTEIMAHRGASAKAPENTIAAIQGAIDSGADWVEIDVQETADGEIVVIHDSDLKKIGGVGLVVATSTAAELMAVDIGSWFSSEFSDQRVPLLSQVLAMCKDRIGVNIELKYYGREKQLELRVAKLVEAADMVDQVVVMSLNYAGMQEMRRLRPHWKLGLLSSVALGDLAHLDIDFLALNGRAASRSLVRHTHEQGSDVMVWTINDAVGMSNMMGRGVDVIITDEPALAVHVLQQRKELDSAQRLLMQLADFFEQPFLYEEQ
jgi:glycerophosphoryl diester phosphodiesterase